MDEAQCLGDLSSIFVQVGCVLPAYEIKNRKEEGLLIGCLAVFLALFIINYFDYIRKNQEFNYIEWDVKTITAGDYTVEFDIMPGFFEEWLETEAENFLEEQ